MRSLKFVDTLMDTYPTVQVWVGNSFYIGCLYMKNERVLVLVNNLCSAADLNRKWKKMRYDHVEPEADIRVLPTRKVDKIVDFREICTPRKRQ
jgi:hypothetical protein